MNLRCPLGWNSLVRVGVMQPKYDDSQHDNTKEEIYGRHGDNILTRLVVPQVSRMTTLGSFLGFFLEMGHQK